MTKTLIAKPVVKNQFWIVTDGTKKVGNVIAEGSGYEVKLNNKSEHYETTNAIEKFKKIKFEKLNTNPNENPLFNEFPTPAKVYNNVFDVKRKLHLFTETPKSKCYHAAGWFMIKQTDEFASIFCPKYIFIQRYEYSGPFKTESEAKSSINTI